MIDIVVDWYARLTSIDRSSMESRYRHRRVTLLERLITWYCRYIWKKPGLAKRVLFFISDWKTLFYTGVNELYYLLRFDRGFRITNITLELASRCNLDCTICARFSAMKRDQGYMAWDTFKAVIDNNPEVGMYTLVGWGEMMMNKIFWDALAYLKERGKRVALTTNATLLNEKNVEKMVRSSIDHITISMDGVDGVYEAIRGIKFEKVEKNLIRLSNRIKETGADIYLEINAAGTPEVIAQAEETKRRLGPYVDDIRFSTYVEYNKGLKTNRTKPCREFWRGMITVWSNGGVVPCCMDYNSTMMLGSAIDTPLKKLWNHETNRRFRREHLRGEFKRRCETCYEAAPPENDLGIDNRFVD